MNKEKLLKIFGTQLDKIFTEIDIQREKLDNIGVNIQEKTLQFTGITSEYDRVIAEIKKAKEGVDRDRVLLMEQKGQINTEKNTWAAKQNEMDRQLELFESTFKKMKVEKDILEKDIQNMKVIEGIKDGLVKDVSVLKDEYQQEKKRLSELRQENADYLAELQIEVDNLKQEKQRELDKVIPTIEELEVKQKQLTQKEKGLSIIEKRYKKLFDEQGGGFKI